jgi:hypothetical protein
LKAIAIPSEAIWVHRYFPAMAADRKVILSAPDCRKALAVDDVAEYARFKDGECVVNV